jgi:acetate kinase
MAEVILVLNASSSSLKYSVFLNGEPPEPFLRGQLEGLFTQPRFVARDHAGGLVGEKAWAAGTKLGLGLEFDEPANNSGGPRISQTESRVSAWVIPTNEELRIAQHTQRLLASNPSKGQPATMP